MRLCRRRLVLLAILIMLSACTEKAKVQPRLISLEQHYITAEDTAYSFEPLPLTTDRYITMMSQPETGVLEYTGGGIYTYTPEPNRSGTVQMRFTLDDGRSGMIHLAVEPVNDKPIANNDFISTRQSQTVSIAVLSNDMDYDGQSLHVTAVGQPDKGSVSINADGTLKYTAPADFLGELSFSYTVSDGESQAQAYATVFVLSQERIATMAAEPGAIELHVGQSLRVSARTQAGGGMADLTQLAQWSSSAATVVTVGDTLNDKGLVAGIASGNAVITAVFEDAQIQLNVTVLPAPPAAPTGVTVSQPQDTLNVDVAWESQAGLTYNVYLKPEGASTRVFPNASQPFRQADLNAGARFSFWVTAINAGGESKASDQVQIAVRPLPPNPTPEPTPSPAPNPAPPEEKFVDFQIIDATIDKSGDVAQGETIHVNFTVKNNGTVTSSTTWNTNFNIGIGMDPNPAAVGYRLPGRIAGIRELPLPAPGVNVSYTMDYQVPFNIGDFRATSNGFGQHYLRVVADVDNLEVEKNENNNEFVVPVALNIVQDDREDLTVETVSSDKTAYTVNDPIVITNTVKNIGASPTYGHHVIFLLVPKVQFDPLYPVNPITRAVPERDYIGFRWVAGLLPQQSHSASFTTFIPLFVEPGEYYLVAYVNPWREQIEVEKISNPGNNIRAAPSVITINPGAFTGPDLAVTDFQIPVDFATLETRQPIPMVFTIQNLGDMPTSPNAFDVAGFTAALELSAPAVTYSPWFSLGTYPELKPGEAMTVRRVLTNHRMSDSWPLEGDTTFTLIADVYNQRLDSNQNNNRSAITTRIINNANVDFTVTDFRVDAPSPVGAGNEVFVDYTLKNIGAAHGWATGADFLLVDGAAGNWSMGTRIIPYLEPNGTFSERVALPVPFITGGNYQIVVTANASLKIPENNVGNNSQSLPLTVVADASLKFDSVEFPALVASGSTNTALVHITNTGTTTAKTAAARITPVINGVPDVYVQEKSISLIKPGAALIPVPVTLPYTVLPTDDVLLLVDFLKDQKYETQTSLGINSYRDLDLEVSTLAMDKTNVLLSEMVTYTFSISNKSSVVSSGNRLSVDICFEPGTLAPFDQCTIYQDSRFYDLWPELKPGDDVTMANLTVTTAVDLYSGLPGETFTYYARIRVHGIQGAEDNLSNNMAFFGPITVTIPPAAPVP